MIEAVNAAVSSASVLRASAEQAAAARALSSSLAPPRSVSQPGGYFIGPDVRIDSGFGKVITSLRDSKTGNVIKQFPAESILRFRSVSQVAAQVSSVPDALIAQPLVQPTTTTTATVSAAPQQQQSFSAPAQTANTNAPSPASFQTAAAAFSAGAQTSQGATSTVQVEA